MTLTAIILLIVLGIFLFLVEFLLVPGVTIAGIAGFILLVGGIWVAYDSLGTPAAHYVLAGTLALSFVTIYFSLRSRTWKRLMLDSSIEGKVSSYTEDKVHIGDEGLAVTRLNPMGKVMINDEFLEAKSNGPYIEQQKKIRVINIKDFRVIVEPIEDTNSN